MPATEHPPTIYAVAKLSGLSIATVTQAIDSPYLVSEKTRKIIFKTIDKLAYIPKVEFRARALRSIGGIGVFTPFFTTPSFGQRLRGIASALSNTNFNMVIHNVDSNQWFQSYLSSLPITGNSDGLIIGSFPITEEDFHRFLEYKLSTVLIEYYQPLLTIRQNLDDSGRFDIEILLAQINNPSRPVQHSLLPLTVIEWDIA